MIKYKIKTASVMCTMINTESGETLEGQFLIQHPIKMFNERTKKRILKEVNEKHLEEGSKLKAIFVKSYENSECVMGMELETFLKYAQEIPSGKVNK